MIRLKASLCFAFLLTLWMNIGYAQKMTTIINDIHFSPYRPNHGFLNIDFKNHTSDTIFIEKKQFDEVQLVWLSRMMDEHNHILIKNLDTNFQDLITFRTGFVMNPYESTDSAFILHFYDSLMLAANNKVRMRQFAWDLYYVVPPKSSQTITVGLRFVSDELDALQKLSKEQIEKMTMKLVLNTKYRLRKSKKNDTVQIVSSESALLKEKIYDQFREDTVMHSEDTYNDTAVLNIEKQDFSLDIKDILFSRYDQTSLFIDVVLKNKRPDTFFIDKGWFAENMLNAYLLQYPSIGGSGILVNGLNVSLERLEDTAFEGPEFNMDSASAMFQFDTEQLLKNYEPLSRLFENHPYYIMPPYSKLDLRIGLRLYWQDITAFRKLSKEQIDEMTMQLVLHLRYRMRSDEEDRRTLISSQKSRLLKRAIIEQYKR